MVMTIIVFILVFGVVVISHELGHFLIAKLNGIRVLEFAIGMGPSIVKFTKGGTRYVLKLLPIGGACMFEGEDGVYEKKDEDGKENAKAPSESGALGKAFNEVNVWARIATVFAGPFFNIILAFLLSLIASAMNMGEPMEIAYRRGNEKHTATVLPKFSSDDNRYYIGFTIG